MRKKAIPTVHRIMISMGEVENMSRTTNEESEEIKGRESYLVKIKEMVFDLRKCELYPMLSGYQEIRTCHGDKMIFIIHGGPGCAIWFRGFAYLSKTGRIWEMNEEGRQLKITRNEEDYHTLARRFGRYKRARTEALGGSDKS